MLAHSYSSLTARSITFYYANPKLMRNHSSLASVSVAYIMFMQIFYAVGCGDNAVRLFEGGQLQNGELSGSQDDHEAAMFQLALTKQQAHNADVNCVQWSPKDPTLLATAGDDNTVRLWRYRPDPDSSVMTG